MKVLFCTDGSEASYYAIKKTLPFLKADYEINIITVMDWGFFPTYVTFPAEEEIGFPGHKNIAENILDKTIKLIESEGYNVAKADYSTGNPAESILKSIKSEKFDLAVLGSHGKKGFTNWLGSVSRKVVTKSPVPVLIARPPKEPEKTVSKGTNEILLATDGSGNSYNAITKMANLLNLENSSIEVMTVKPGAESLPLEIVTDTAWLNDSLTKQQEIADEILAESRKILGKYNISPQKAFTLEGDPADEILKYTQNNPKDLIVMGSHGREGISDILLGSVSKRVLDNATSPVMIVPSKKESIH
ncbi:MAG: universal stress protein [Candidatus Gastranaerophilales bacterium]|nr:universal stress protein [Candidatus Gastranaerophilales bacterium]